MQRDTIYTVAFVRTEDDKPYKGAVGFYTLESAISQKDLWESYGWDVTIIAHIEDAYGQKDLNFGRYKITVEKLS